MKVSDLAKNLNTTVETILQTLKSFKLKAKDGDQDLSAAVVSVVRSELVKAKKAASKAPSPGAEAKGKTAKTAGTVEKTKDTELKVKKEPPAAKAPKKAVKKVAPAAEPAPAPAAVPPPPKPAAKPKMTISNEPMITLKPLARKKRKVMGPSTPEITAHPAAADQTATVAPARISAPVTEQMTPPSDLVDLEIQLPVTVKDFSAKIQQKPSVVLKSLLKMGILAHINQSLDGEIVNILAKGFGYNIIKIKTQ
ncbi:MAG: translation initiation factor IF-2 N-terminal domain-containing protein, partial [Candidatus Omnitrophica bacterium]|nr:translation initiation factor IF-2 N-terminal domain-containing protein [Candidatus Omnitrophota bacterium]